MCYRCETDQSQKPVVVQTASSSRRAPPQLTRPPDTESPTLEVHRFPPTPRHRWVAEAALKKSTRHHLLPKRAAEMRRTPPALSFESQFPAKKHAQRRISETSDRSQHAIDQLTRTAISTRPHKPNVRQNQDAFTYSPATIKKSAEFFYIPQTFFIEIRQLLPTLCFKHSPQSDIEPFNSLEHWLAHSASVPAD